MHESPLKPKFVLVMDFEPVAAHYYRVAGLSPLYFTAKGGVNVDEAQARVYSSKGNATRAGERAKKNLWGIESFRVEQINAKANDGPGNTGVWSQ